MCKHELINCISDTVMRIFKLNLFSVPVHLHSGYSKMIFVIISPLFGNIEERCT